MITLRIEHKISNYEGWKKAFDSDPINRKKAGVKQYRIYRPTDDPDFVIIELDFENLEGAEGTRKALQTMWTQVEGSLIFGPQIRVMEIVASKEL
ncbi:MAG TPA: hypothetical protein VK666_19195 [Chryseolinea sp.]|nr:hypothetical protein [Chryseolinea sp.]